LSHSGKPGKGLLAQLVEQRTLNPLVDSSNLSGPTNILLCASST
jgi:hypothetical protein